MYVVSSLQPRTNHSWLVQYIYKLPKISRGSTTRSVIKIRFAPPQYTLVLKGNPNNANISLRVPGYGTCLIFLKLPCRVEIYIYDKIFDSNHMLNEARCPFLMNSGTLVERSWMRRRGILATQRISRAFIQVKAWEGSLLRAFQAQTWSGVLTGSEHQRKPGEWEFPPFVLLSL